MTQKSTMQGTETVHIIRSPKTRDLVDSKKPDCYIKAEPTPGVCNSKYFPVKSQFLSETGKRTSNLDIIYCCDCKIVKSF